MLNNRNMGIIQSLNTLTAIDNKINSQKFYTIPNIPDYVDIETGQYQGMEQVMKWFGYDNVGDFESGVSMSGADYERTASADVIRTTKIFKRLAWRKSVSYNIYDDMKAKVVGFKIIEEKLAARKRNWDLGVQENIFLGSKLDSDITGLLNNKEVSVDTSMITKPIYAMNDAEFNNLLISLPRRFNDLTNGTAMFNRLVIPTKDYYSLGGAASTTFPIKSRRDLLEESLKINLAGQASGFKILPCQYCDKEHNNLGYDMYMLYNKDKDVLVYDNAMDYKTTAFNTYDGFNYINIGWGCFGCVQVIRPQECLYMPLV